MAAPDLRTARERAGLTQRALAARSGVPQPHIARIESGQVVPKPETVDRLLRAARPPALEVLRAHRDDIVDAATRAHGTGRVHVFGSVARGDDGPDSDIDLLVEFTDEADLFDVVRLETTLGDLLGRPVDVVSSRAGGRAFSHARRDMIPLP